MRPLSPAGPVEETRQWWRHRRASPRACGECCHTFHACPCCRTGATDRKIKEKKTCQWPRARVRDHECHSKTERRPVENGLSINVDVRFEAVAHQAIQHFIQHWSQAPPIHCVVVRLLPQDLGSQVLVKRSAETWSKSPVLGIHTQSLGSTTNLRRATKRAGGIGQGNALLAQAEVCQDDVALWREDAGMFLRWHAPHKQLILLRGAGGTEDPIVEQECWRQPSPASPIHCSLTF